MILGFKPEMVEPYVKKQKKHSIRIDKHNRWKAGRSIQLATGVRTKKYKQFGTETCKSTQPIEIGYYKYGPYVKINGKELYTKNIKELAFNDGFKSAFDFFQWFCPESYLGAKFIGKIIHWTDLKY